MLTQIDSLPVIQAPVFAGEDWLRHGFGLKDIPIERYLEIFGLTQTVVPKTKQVHGNKVHLLGRESLEKIANPLEGDGFLTDKKGVVCISRTADCLPILFADPKNRAVGAVHSGWRGMTEQVVVATFEAMKKQWGSRPEDLKVALGPAIGGHCYRIGIEVVRALEKVGLYPGPWIEEKDHNNWYLDIAFANRHLLERLGIPRENLYLSLACTACDNNRFRSYRKEGGKFGEQVSFIVKIED